MHDGTKNTKYRSTVGNALEFVETDDELLILCQHGFMSFRNGKMSEADINMGALAKKDVVFSKITSIPDGTMYVGTRGKGLYRISPAHPRRLESVSINTYGIDPSTAKIAAVMTDRRGNLWLGCHRKGLLMVPSRPVQFNSWSFAAQGVNLGSTISSVSSSLTGSVGLNLINKARAVNATTSASKKHTTAVRRLIFLRTIVWSPHPLI
jgi:ligand-binding sensor domain-containing protein